MDLSRRSEMPEMMDDADISVLDYAQALRDLATVNRITRTHAPVLAWLRRATRDWPEGRAVSVLDVASGQGDLLRAIHSWATRRGLMPVLSGIDLNPSAAIEAVAATPTGTVIAWETGDVFDQAPEPKPDFVVSSQFAHHLTDDQVVAFLLWLERNSRRGWFIADLHRHALPYYGFRLLCRAAGWHRIVRLDGTVSIARGFRTPEWRALLARAGLNASISWHLLFRLCVGRLK